MPESENAEFDHRVKAAMDAEVPQLYSNGFAVSLSNADGVIVFEKLGRPVVMVNLSYTAMKSLAVNLGRIIGEMEELTGRDFLTTVDVDRAVAGRKS